MRLTLSVLGIMVLLVTSVHAIKADSDTVAQREDLLIRETPMVTAASRYEQGITEAPSFVTVITDEEIKNFGYRTLAEALRGVVGFYTTNDREYVRLGDAGFLRPGDWGNRILLMINGHYCNENIYGGAYTDNTFGIDIGLVKRIEIIRGPGSALYGTDALFAVINVVTKTGEEIDSPNAAVEYGTNNTEKGSFSFGKNIKDDANMLIAASLFNSDGYKTLYFKEFDTPATNNGIAQNLDWERASTLFANLNYGDLSVMANTNYREKAFPTAAYGTVFNDSRASDIDKRSFVDIKFQPKISYDKTGLLRFYYDQYSYTGNYPYNYPPIALSRDYSEGNWWGSEMQLTWDIPRVNKLIVGGEYQDHTKVLLENYRVDPYTSYLFENHPQNIWSMYLQDEIKTEKVGLSLGVRNDNYPVFGNVLNPRLGLVFNPWGNNFIKVLYGRAFRAPTPFEKYYNDGGVSSKGNLNLNPEIINTYQLVYEYGSFGDLYFTLSTYQYYISDLITQVTDPADNLLQYQNIGKVRSTGTELSVRKTFKNSYGYIGYAYNRTISESTGQMLENSPENSGNAGFVYFFPDHKYSLATELIYLGQRKTLAGNYTGSYLLTNLNLRTEKFLDCEISLKINNLFDTLYSDPGSGEHVKHVMDTITQDGRTISLKVGRKF